MAIIKNVEKNKIFFNFFLIKTFENQVSKHFRKWQKKFEKQKFDPTNKNRKTENIRKKNPKNVKNYEKKIGYSLLFFDSYWTDRILLFNFFCHFPKSFLKLGFRIFFFKKKWKKYFAFATFFCWIFRSFFWVFFLNVSPFSEKIFCNLVFEINNFFGICFRQNLKKQNFFWFSSTYIFLKFFFSKIRFFGFFLLTFLWKLLFFKFFRQFTNYSNPIGSLRVKYRLNDYLGFTFRNGASGS